REAYKLKPVATLLYDLGLAYEKLKDLPRARDAFRGYIETPLSAEERERVQKRIEAIDRALAPPTPTVAPPPPTVTVVTTEPPPPARSPVPWIAIGLGASGLVAGGVLGGVALARNSAAKDDPVQASAAATADQARSFALASMIGFVAGAGVAAVG